MLFSRLAQSAAALLLLTIGFAAPVHAQVNKQIISGNWYEDRATLLSVPNNTTITLTFAQTPTNQFLNITNVSCTVNVNSIQVISNMILYAGSTPGMNDLARPYSIRGGGTPETNDTIKLYSIVQNGIFYKMGPGRYPSIEIDTVSSGALTTSASCVIVGNLTDS
jgi:hypothetical protein